MSTPVVVQGKFAPKVPGWVFKVEKRQILTADGRKLPLSNCPSDSIKGVAGLIKTGASYTGVYFYESAEDASFYDPMSAVIKGVVDRTSLEYTVTPKTAIPGPFRVFKIDRDNGTYFEILLGGRSSVCKDLLAKMIS